jgi:transposase-like protein
MDLDFDKYKAQQFCDNLDCPYHGKTGANNIRTHSHLHHQVDCHACKQIWVMTKGTFFYSLKAPVSLILEVLKLWSEGMGLRAVCRSKRVTPAAVSAWVQKAAQHVREVTVYLERDRHLTQCQIDAFWSYILKKSEPERRRMGSRGLGG